MICNKLAGFALSLALLLSPFRARAESFIPSLDWQKRSDWIDVKSDVSPKAVGNGLADDTVAIQTALDKAGQGGTIYLPAGTYRITKTLTLKGPIVGVLVIGHGRDTKIVWDGEKGGRMFWSNGAAYSHYVGLVWDGRGIAAVGFDHAAKKRFETEILHRHEAFLNFTECGIRIGHQQKIASAEIEYENCVFENCGVGVATLAFNDYDNTFDGCEFRNCGTAILDRHGNFYARNCHFENSRKADFDILSEHGDSIRRCSSYGSWMFLRDRSIVAPLTVEDCRVAGWRNPEGAVDLHAAPVLMFDCVFESPPKASPPVRVRKKGQRLLLSNNRSVGTRGLIKDEAGARIVNVPLGKLKGTLSSARQSFLRSQVRIPRKVFDAKRDFGAKGDGKSDDTKAIQSAIDAARTYGRDAIAYLPRGRYVITRTLQITGRNYFFGGGGSGFRTAIIWRGPQDGTALAVRDADNVTIQNICIGHHDLGRIKGAADIEQMSSGKRSFVVYDQVFLFGMYQKKPGVRGLRLTNLPRSATVLLRHLQGNIFVRNCAGTVLARNSYEGAVVVEGKKARSGFLGFMTRLATITNPTLIVRDNQSIVMSDFYVEQSDRHVLLEGSPDLPPGAVTIGDPKIHLNTRLPIMESRNYRGRISFLPAEFYCKPQKAIFRAQGLPGLTLILGACYFYRVSPVFELEQGTKVIAAANENFPDRGTDSLAPLSEALDDLRRLGKTDAEVRQRFGQ